MAAKSVLGMAFVSALGVTLPALAGPDWVENGDAGSFYSTAQRTFGAGQLHTVSGSLTGHALLGAGDFEDMFLITITNPAAFSMKILGADFDAQLFLFNITLPGEAFGLLANDDTAEGNSPFIGNVATDMSGAQVNLPGIYAIAVSGKGRNPISNGGLIFNIANATEVSGPDGPGGTNPHNGWTGEGQSGSYIIALTGAAPSDIPAPGSLALLLLSAGCLVRRRRRN